MLRQSSDQPINRLIHVRESTYSTIEAVFYASNHDTLITITKGTRLGLADKRYQDIAFIYQTKSNQLANTAIFNIHVDSDQDAKACEDKLKEAKCEPFFSKKDNNFHIKNENFEYVSRFSNASSKQDTLKMFELDVDLSEISSSEPEFPEVFLRDEGTAQAAATGDSRSSSKSGKEGFGYNFYMDDIKNGLLETFFKNGTLPLPRCRQKPLVTDKVEVEAAGQMQNRR